MDATEQAQDGNLSPTPEATNSVHQWRPPTRPDTHPPAASSNPTEETPVTSDDTDFKYQPWPGPDFKLSTLLPDSVYLWACGERSNSENDESAVSRSEVVAAWVILISQILCYSWLVHMCNLQSWDDTGNSSLSSSSPPYVSTEATVTWATGKTASESSSSATSTTADYPVNSTTPKYSVAAISAAMYLILFIAAADLWGAIALITERCLYGPTQICASGSVGAESEGVGSRLAVRRWPFGVMLLVSFVMLLLSSTWVLFYTSFEDATLVIGATAVLFIADVDEKAMNVLKSVTHEWRLFWVLQAIGVSFGLALFAVFITGNDVTVSADSSNCDSELFWSIGCNVYNRSFIISYNTTAVTVCSLLVSSAVASPGKFMPTCLCNNSCTNRKQWLLFATLLVPWALSVVCSASDHLLSILGVLSFCVVVFVSVNCFQFERWQNILLGLACGTWLDMRPLRLPRSRPLFVGLKVAGWLMAVGLVFVFADGVLIVNLEAIVAYVSDRHLFTFVIVLDTLFACYHLVVNMWIVLGMTQKNTRSSADSSPLEHISRAGNIISPLVRSNRIAPSADGTPAASHDVVPPIQPLLLGWGIETTFHLCMHFILAQDSIPFHLFQFSVHVVWAVALGVWIRIGRGGDVNGVAFWVCATYLRMIVGRWVAQWVSAFVFGVVT